MRYYVTIHKYIKYRDEQQGSIMFYSKNSKV